MRSTGCGDRFPPRIDKGLHRGFESPLSAGYKIPPRQRKLHLLPDLIILVVGLSRCKGSATEIAQSPLHASRVTITETNSRHKNLCALLFPSVL
jgi:hypothetical protein